MGRNPYNEVPYPGVPFAQTHPDRLAVLGELFGMRPAPVERCRVLELGCGDGANLIPMAVALPEARFVGIDAAGVPIARGRSVVGRLGLGNVALRRQDLRAFARRPGPDAGPFDYIIAHGVYSWVPDGAREALLAIVRDRLAPHGVAYVSYNAYPGCHVRDLVRGMLQYHAAGPADGRLAVARAQGLARLLAEALPAADELAFLRTELSAVAERAPGVVFHDELAPENRPCYFHEFAARAARHGLQYLAEADFHEMQAGWLAPGLAEILASVERERGLVAREQYLDFLKLRRFRQTLLCRAEVPLDRAIGGERIAHFSVASPVEPAATTPDLRPGVVEEFRGPNGALIRVDLPLAKAALLHLGDAWPRRVPFAELRAAARARLDGSPDLAGPTEAAEAGALADILLEAYGAGQVQLHTFMPALALEPGERPTASPLARLQARRADPPLVSTLLHTAVRIDDALGQYAITLLDGTRDRTALLMALRRRARAEERAISAPGSASGVEVSPARLEDTLRGLAHLGLLVA